MGGEWCLEGLSSKKSQVHEGVIVTLLSARSPYSAEAGSAFSLGQPSPPCGQASARSLPHHASVQPRWHACRGAALTVTIHSNSSSIILKGFVWAGEMLNAMCALSRSSWPTCVLSLIIIPVLHIGKWRHVSSDFLKDTELVKPGLSFSQNL